MNWLRASVVAAKSVGMCCLALGVWKAYWYMHKFVRDPHDVEGSLEKLLETSDLARSTIGAGVGGALGNPARAGDATGDIKRIGRHPLGERRIIEPRPLEKQPPRAPPGPRVALNGVTVPPAKEEEPPTAMSRSLQLRGASRAETPLVRSTTSTQKELTEGLVQAVVGLQEYLSSDAGFGRDVRRLGDAVDTAVLVGGDSVGRAVDEVISGARGVGERAIEAASEKTNVPRLVGRKSKQK